MLSSFEPGGSDLVQGDGHRVREHATDGQYALRVESDGRNYLGLRIQEGRPLQKFKDYVLLKVDVFSLQPKPVRCTARIDDVASKDYGSRYNDDEVVMPPGRSTFEINLTGLTKSNARNFSQRQRLDLATARLMTLCIAPVGDPLTLYFDNIRLEGSGLPRVQLGYERSTSARPERRRIPALKAAPTRYPSAGPRPQLDRSGSRRNRVPARRVDRRLSRRS